MNGAPGVGEGDSVTASGAVVVYADALGAVAVGAVVVGAVAVGAVNVNGSGVEVGCTTVGLAMGVGVAVSHKSMY